MLETIHGFQHITDTLNANAVGSLVAFVAAIIGIKLVVTLSASMVRDDSRKMDAYRRVMEHDKSAIGNGNEDAGT